MVPAKVEKEKALLIHSHAGSKTAEHQRIRNTLYHTSNSKLQEKRQKIIKLYDYHDKSKFYNGIAQIRRELI